MEELIKNSITTQYKAIFPETLNANETLFGGHTLKWMDEVAFITATRFTRERMFTTHIEKIKFIKAIQPQTIIEIIGSVENVSMIRIYVKVVIFVEEMYNTKREKAVEGTFVFVTLDKNKRPTKLNLKRNRIENDRNRDKV